MVFPVIWQAGLTGLPMRARIVGEGRETTMQALLTHITATVLFIHTIVGCCWHHAHLGPGSTTTTAPLAGCCHHHHEQDSQPRQSPDPCQSECEGSCQYIAPQKVCIDAPQGAQHLDYAATESAQTLARFPSLPTGGSLDSLHGAALPLRTHLMHQVLLI